ncbi:MAG: dienelactone hydrolase family protein [Halofilum sp. (in: g-proteobacteria)]|nr:dienelactone hydrolase family protein [Halofilum sp. (in: g-proteobacteria)]
MPARPAPRDDYVERMAEQHAGDTPVANVDADAAGLEVRTVDYASLDGRPVSGYLARPAEADGPLPALIVIHEWWGLNDNIRAMTRRLAAAGHVALAVDLYEGEAATEPGNARALMQAAMDAPGRVRRNLRQAFHYLDAMPGVGRIASIGWCFGGGWSLRTALLFPEALDAAVIYYGRLVTEREALAPLAMPIQGHFGAEDDGIPVANVRRFERVLDELGKTHEIHVYEGAGHAFANPSGTRYVEEAAEKAWERTLAFLERHL